MYTIPFVAEFCGFTPLTGSQFGDGFARVDMGAADDTAALQTSLLSVLAGQPQPLASQLLTGANVWLLQRLNASLPAASGGITLWAEHVPDALWAGGQISQDALNSYLLDTRGYDCVFDASIETGSGALPGACVRGGYDVCGGVGPGSDLGHCSLTKLMQRLLGVHGSFDDLRVVRAQHLQHRELSEIE